MNSDYKIKYFKYKNKYEKLLFIKGGMLALQNSDQRIKRIQRQSIEKGNKIQREILNYLQKSNYEIKSQEELQALVIDNDYGLRDIYLLANDDDDISELENPLQTIEKDGNNIKIISSVLSRLGDLLIKTTQKTMYEDIINIMDKFIGMLYFLYNEPNPLIKILPTPYDSFVIDSKIHYMDILLRHNLCDPETIILYNDIVNKKENIEKRSEKTKYNLKKLFDSPKLYYQRSLNNRVDELLPFVIEDIYFQKTGEIVADYRINSKEKFKEWKIIYIKTTTYEEKIIDILKLNEKYSDIEIVFKTYEIDRFENETRKLFLKFPFSGSSKCGIKVSLGRSINTNNIYNLLFNYYNKKYIKILRNDYSNVYENELIHYVPDPAIDDKNKKKIYKKLLLEAQTNYDSEMIDFKSGDLPTKPEIPPIIKKANKKILIRSCVGMFYGLILQPINHNYSKYGEIRCICYKGDIKVVVFNTPNPHVPFVQNIFHRSIFEKRLDYIKKEEILLKLICKKILDLHGEYFYSKYLDDFQLSNTNIVDSCKKTYQILKNELKIEGIHHRIDFINSRDNINHYFINEVENINFGNAVNYASSFEINYSDSIGNILYLISPRGLKYINNLNEYDNFYTINKNILDNLKIMKPEEHLELRRNIKDFFNLAFTGESRFKFKFNGLRELLLSFNY
jgi:hypothetical protein